MTITGARLVPIRRVRLFALARGLTRFEHLDASQGTVTTVGVVLGVRATRSGQRMFASLTDGRDQIQIVVSTGAAMPAEILAGIQIGTSVSVTGIPFLCGRTQESSLESLFVQEIRVAPLPPSLTFREDNLRREVLPRLVLGQLLTLVSERLDTMGYLRYEPSLITSSPGDLATEPLGVRFPGRGADLSLEVSPLPQLLYAAVMSAHSKLYSASRLFSRAYRDGFTSPDSSVVGAVEILSARDSESDFADSVSLILESLGKAEEKGVPFHPAIELRSEKAAPRTDDANGGTHVIKQETLDTPLTSEYAYDVRKKLTVESPSGLVVIEGHEGAIADTMRYRWLCFHAERLVASDMWRIRRRAAPESMTT